MERKEIEARITEREEFGVYDINPALFGGVTRISNGIRLALTEDVNFIKTSPFSPTKIDLAPSIKNETLCEELKESAKRFFNNDFGTFYTYGDPIIKGREWGEYETAKGAIYIHREGQTVVLFFPFER